MTQTLTPIDTISNTYGTLVGAATAHEALDETIASTDDDTSYIADNAAAAWVGHVTSISEPQAGTVSVTMRWRERTGTGVPSTLALTLATDADGDIATLPIAANPSSYTNAVLTLSAGERASITDWANLRVRVNLFTTTALQVRVTTVEVSTPDPVVGGGWFSPMWRS